MSARSSLEACLALPAQESVETADQQWSMVPRGLYSTAKQDVCRGEAAHAVSIESSLTFEWYRNDGPDVHPRAEAAREVAAEDA